MPADADVLATATLSSDGAVTSTGSREHLTQLAEVLLRQKVPARAGRDHEHAWALVEGGYTRAFTTTVGPDSVIEVVLDDDDAFADQGDGEYRLECRTCPAVRPLSEKEQAAIRWC